MLIYMATNRVNGKEYIGQTIGSLKHRKQGHITDAKLHRDVMYFHKALRKYGFDNFDWEILHDNITNINDLNKSEIYYIKLYDTFENGYNLNAGGKNALTSHKTRKKISENHVDFSGENHPMYGKRGKHSPVAKAIIINNKYFDTLKEAADLFDFTPTAIRYRILHKTRWTNYSYA